MSSFRDDLLKRVRRLVKRGVLADRRVVLFGASLACRIVLDELQRSGVTVDAIVDSSREKVGRSLGGYVIGAVDSVLSPPDPRVAVVVISAAFGKEMEHTLRQLGYPTAQIHQACAAVSDTTGEFVAALAGLPRARWNYGRLAGSAARSRGVLFIAPYEGTGDIYLIGLFFHEYLRRHAIVDYTFAVVSGACGRVAGLCGIENVVVRTTAQLNGIIHWATFTHRGADDIVVLNDGWLSEAAQWLRGYKGLNFERMFRYFVFGFDDDVPLQLPRPPGEADGTGLLRERGLAVGRTVVLAPYANTLNNIPEIAFWADVADSLARRGFTVVTNCVGSERPVPGTEAVSFAFDDAVAFMDAAGHFVGVRSGLCDIISASSCRMVILYDGDGRFYKGSFLEYFSLRAMGLNADAIEIEYRVGHESDAAAAILAALV